MKLTSEQRHFIEFLYGKSTWLGAWFGETLPGRSGVFWWREELERLFGPNAEAAPKVGNDHTFDQLAAEYERGRRTGITQVYDAMRTLEEARGLADVVRKPT